MKKFFAYNLFTVIIFLLSCTEEIDSTYKGGEKIYFEYEYQDPFYALPRMIKRDSLVISMGKLPVSQNEYELNIPVKILGQPLFTDKHYKVKVIQTGSVVYGQTSAVENVHYKPFPEIQTFKADSWTDTLRVTLFRSALSTNFNTKEKKTLLIGLVETDELKLGLRDGWEIKISLNNYIDQPEWWNSFALGFYHPEKYKILLLFESEEFYGSVDIMNGAKRYIDALRAYLLDNVIIDEETGKRVGFDSLIDI